MLGFSEDYTYRNGHLYVEGVSLAAIARAHGTPLYVYSGASVTRAYERIDRCLSSVQHRIAYAVKANGNLHLLRRLRALGSAVDIVSGGELARVREAGFSPSDVVFSGVGKRDEEIEAALAWGIRSLHVESAEELDNIARIAGKCATKARVSLRVNPDVDPQTHPYIATGMHEAKFGMAFDEARALLPRCLADDSLELEGLTCHIGSQIGSADSVRQSTRLVASLAIEFIEQGAPLRLLDAGGGWPIAYGGEGEDFASWEAFGRAVTESFREAGPAVEGLALWVEPGRALVGQSGVLLTEVLYTKHRPLPEAGQGLQGSQDPVIGAATVGEQKACDFVSDRGDLPAAVNPSASGLQGKRFAIIDAGITELIRPALYEAHHEIKPLQAPQADASLYPVDVVGPICESGDFFAKGRLLPPLRRGDLFAVGCTGAYASVMASNYNDRPKAAHVWVEGDTFFLVQRREPLEDLWRLEQL